MQTIPTAADIRAELARHRLLGYVIATKVGIHPNNLSGILHERRPLSADLAVRLMAAIALAGEPRLLIADEPTTNLDVTIQAGFIQLLESCWRSTLEYRLGFKLPAIYCDSEPTVLDEVVFDKGDPRVRRTPGINTLKSS